MAQIGAALFFPGHGFDGLVFHTCHVGQFFQGFVERKPFHFHQKPKDIAAFLAAETVEKPLFATASEGRGLLFMKRTTGLVGFTRAFKTRYILPDKFHNVYSVFDCFDDIVVLAVPPKCAWIKGKEGNSPILA